MTIKFQSFVDFWDHLPEDERIIVDVLRQLVLTYLPSTVKEKLSYNVPFYYGNRRICLIWPASVKGGGIRSGVLFGFTQGYKLNDSDNYLLHGKNKQVYYKIYRTVDEIDEAAIAKLLKEAIELDKTFNKTGISGNEMKRAMRDTLTQTHDYRWRVPSDN
jgi:hypothetical protein